MKKKRNLELKSKDIFVICCSLFFTSLFVFLYFKEVNYEQRKENESEIAYILNYENFVERRFIDRNLWTKIKKNSKLYNKDFIRVSPQSTSEILFNDNTKISLSENTMVQIYVGQDGNYATLSDNGEIVVDLSGSNSNFIVTTGKGEKINLNSGSVMSLSTFNSNVELNVKKGNARYLNSEGVEKVVSQGSGITTDEKGMIQSKNFVVLLPEKNSNIFNFGNELKEVKFTWSKNDFLIEKIKLEISNNKSFTNNIVELEIDANDSRKNVFLPNGKYFWKIQLLDESGFEINGNSENGNFNIIDCGLPELIMPLMNESFVKKDENVQVTFKWQEKLFCDSYEFVIARDNKFNHIVTTRKVKDTKLNLSLDVGKYYWKVKPIYNIEGVDQNFIDEYSTFNIKVYEKKESPVVYSPEDNKEFYKLKKSKEKDGVYFSWQDDSDFVEYNFILSKDKNFSSVVKNVKLRESFYFVPITELEIDSVYYWKVCGKFDDGTESKFSDVRKIRIVKNNNLQKKLIYPIDGMHFSLESVVDNSFSWIIEDADFYKVQFSKDKNFKSIYLEKKVTQDSVNGIKFEPGVWYWRVIDNEDVQRITPIGYFIVDEPPHIPVPIKLVYPNDYKKIDGLYCAENEIDFTWETDEKIKNAKFVVKKILDNGAKENYVVRNSLSHIQSVKRLTPGKYTWQVIGSNVFGDDISSDVCQFEVTEVLKLKAPVLIQPENRKIFDAEFLKTKSNLKFEWSAVTGATNYIFTIKKQGQNNSNIVYKNFDSSIKEYNLNDFTIFDNGNYVWSVKAQRIDSTGFIIQDGSVASNSFSMNVQLPGKIEMKNSGIQYGE